MSGKQKPELSMVGTIRGDKGKTFYELLWCEKLSRSGSVEEHSVWRRFSEFEALKKFVVSKKGGGGDHTARVKSLSFPKKTATKLKSNGSSAGVVEARQEELRVWLQSVMQIVPPDAEGKSAGRKLFDFLHEGSDPAFHKAMAALKKDNLRFG